VAAGLSHTVVRTIDGSVWTFGQNDYGQLGDGNPHRALPRPLHAGAVAS
jgi:alpha-tubulin suppressor-like RCC1 family protein